MALKAKVNKKCEYSLPQIEFLFSYSLADYLADLQWADWYCLWIERHSTTCSVVVDVDVDVDVPVAAQQVERSFGYLWNRYGRPFNEF